MHLFRIGLQRQFRRSCIFASTESELKSSLDKAPRLSNDIWILSSDTICQLNQLFSNSEAAMLSGFNHPIVKLINFLKSTQFLHCLRAVIMSICPQLGRNSIDTDTILSTSSSQSDHDHIVLQCTLSNC